MTGLIRLLDRPEQRWRNGGGVTREMAAGAPDPAGNFTWRISVATIAANGPFSRFDGMDRSLMLLGGGGLHLNVDGKTVDLKSRQSIRFSGEAVVMSAITDEPAMVLNVMTRRRLASHSLDRARTPDRVRPRHVEMKVFLAALDAVTLTGINMERGDLMELSATDPMLYSAETSAKLARITIDPGQAG